MMRGPINIRLLIDLASGPEWAKHVGGGIKTIGGSTTKHVVVGELMLMVWFTFVGSWLYTVIALFFFLMKIIMFIKSSASKAED